MVDKPRLLTAYHGECTMGIFLSEDKEVTIDVDGGITIDGVLKTPFPADITHAAICDKGLAANMGRP